MIAESVLSNLPQGAWTVIKKMWPLRGLPVVDSGFIGATGEAAALYGVESPEILCTMFTSELRGPEAENVGRIQSYLRNHGVHDNTCYLAEIMRPDGERVLVLKRTHQMVGVNGADVWLTWLERVSEGEPAPVPRLEDHGLDLRDCAAQWGKYTMAEALMWDHSTLPLDIPEKLRDIIGQVGSIRKLVGNGISYSLKTGKVRHHQECSKCYWTWYSHPRYPYQCPESHSDLRPRKRQRKRPKTRTPADSA